MGLELPPAGQPDNLPDHISPLVETGVYGELTKSANGQPEFDYRIFGDVLQQTFNANKRFLDQLPRIWQARALKNLAQLLTEKATDLRGGLRISTPGSRDDTHEITELLDRLQLMGANVVTNAKEPVVEMTEN